MIMLSHKFKQYLLVALKVFILALTFGYIYVKLTANDSLNLKTFFEVLFSKGIDSLLYLLIFLILATANWHFEILKWKTVVSTIMPITFKTALQQSLAALTISLATPNRIGDYGAKAVFFESKKRKQILLLNFFSNIAQMAVTCFFGLIGLVYVAQKFSIVFSTSKLLISTIIIIALCILGFVFKEKQLGLKTLSISKVVAYIKNISLSIKTKVLLFSIARYSIFSTLFYLILIFFGGEILFSEALLLIFTMYLLVSIIPTIFIFDVVVRGGVAVWLFSLVGVPNLIVLCTVFSMWLLNFVIPAIWGSFYVISYKLLDT